MKQMKWQGWGSVIREQANETSGCDVGGNHYFGLRDDAQILQRGGTRL